MDSKRKQESTYHPRTSKIRANGATGNISPRANMPTTTPVTIDETAAHVDTTIALPCFKPFVCQKTETKLKSKKLYIPKMYNTMSNIYLTYNYKHFS